MHTLATLDSWKVFLLLVVSSILMVVLMPFKGLGFLIAAVVIFTWLYSINSELSRATGKSQVKPKVLSTLGLFSVCVFMVAPYLAAFFKEIPFQFIILPIGIVFLVTMLRLMTDAGTLLKEAENLEKPKVSASFLIWLWPLGVWFLQPRLQKVLASNA
ncbi:MULTISPECIES: hypothetical protein [Shewanella]|uniref:Uncharacterized protein n=1 Tax=Shewanella marisflavi TaxID=260364 RepID=A0ABX5WQ58_9GAMM|nr:MULTISPECIES: hypothetical protein [Shewanella]QDF76650.1 hypothetical protein FGA12_16590 [Shewanella marisflavi]